MPRTIAKDYDVKGSVILKKAAKLFADEGFDRASVSSIARACNISKANIYHYYKSKDDILFDILDKYLSELKNRIRNMPLLAESPEERLKATIIEILLAYQGADDEHRLQIESIKHLPKKQQDILLGHQRELVDHMSSLINEISPKVFEVNKDKLRATTMSLFGMLNWYYMWNSRTDEAARLEYANIVSTLCIQGIPEL